MSADQLKSRLAQQLSFLASSAEAYDRGNRFEAVRLATTIRVLLHDTSKSTSLLEHMGKKAILLASSTRPQSPPPPGVSKVIRTGSELAHASLTAGGGLTARAEHCPNLDRWGDTLHFLPVASWWSEVVHHLPDLRRRDLVLTAANKDGGAHVDDEPLPADYQRIKDGIWTYAQQDAAGNVVVAETPIALENLAELRQMAYELLNSPDLLALAL